MWQAAVCYDPSFYSFPGWRNKTKPYLPFGLPPPCSFLLFLYVNLGVKCFLAFGHSPALTKTVTAETPLFQ